MKRILCGILAISLILSLCSLPVMAEDKPARGDTGKYVYFGSYPQDKATDWEISDLRDLDAVNGIKTMRGVRYYNNYVLSGIRWEIVGESGGYYELLSTKVLTTRCYDPSVTSERWWHNCELRTWLNETFLQNAFTEEEQKDIPETEHITEFKTYESVFINKDNTVQQESSREKVYLPGKSFCEGRTAQKNIAYATAYANKNEGAIRYWMRDGSPWAPGNMQHAFVGRDGTFGSWYGTYSYGIRPMIRVSKNSKYLKTVDDSTADRNCWTDHPRTSRFSVKESDTGSAIDRLSLLIRKAGEADYTDEEKTINWDYGRFSDAIEKDKTVVIPGITTTNQGNGTAADQMVPQGTCVTEKYTLISAYDAAEKYNSVIYVLDRSSNRYKTTLVLNNSKGCHVGGLAYVYGKNGGAVFIADSRKSEPCIRKIPESVIQSAVESGKDAVIVNAEKEEADIFNDRGFKPSFITYYGGYLYIGVCNTDDKLESAAFSLNYVKGYPVKNLKLQSSGATPKIKLVGISQGVEFTERGDNTLMLSSASYGRYNTSKFHIADVETNDSTGVPWIRTGFKGDIGILEMPNMSEDIDLDETGSTMKICFESGAATYRERDESKEKSGSRIRPLDYLISAKANVLLSTANLAEPNLTLNDAESEESSEDKIITSGKCGAFVGYTLYESGLLHIAGQGEMEDYGSSRAPWRKYSSSIREITIGADVTHVGNNAFANLGNLESVHVADLSDPSAVLSLGEKAFSGCGNLQNVEIPDKTVQIAGDAFEKCESVVLCSDDASVKQAAGNTGAAYHAHAFKKVKSVKATEDQLYDYDLYRCDCGEEEIRQAVDPDEPVLFTDVKTPSWYSNAVTYVAQRGYMAGKGNNIFDPNGTVTRATITQVLYAMEGKPSGMKSYGFQDVPSGKWYTDSVNWAASVGIVSGYSKVKFGPNDPITRQQMAAIMYQYAKYKKYDTSASGDVSKFKDASSVTRYAVEPMKWAVGHNIISGTKVGLEPKGTATRAQIAVILQAFDKNIRNT